MASSDWGRVGVRGDQSGKAPTGGTLAPVDAPPGAAPGAAPSAAPSEDQEIPDPNI